MNQLKDQHVLILGLGASGLAMARWCARCGAQVTVADTRDTPPQLGALREQLPQAEFVSGAFTAALVEGSNIRAVFRSPGLSPADVAPVVVAARGMGLWVTSELGLFAQALVDLKAGGLSYALDIFERIGVLEAARNGAFTLGLFHIVGSSIASLDEIGEIAHYLTGVDYVLARNFINETNFFGWDDETSRKYFSDVPRASEVDIPKLNEMAYEQVDLAGVTFKDFIDNLNAEGQPGDFSFVLRGYVRKWCSEIDAEFAELKLLQDILNAGRAPAPAPVERAAPQPAKKTARLR